MRITVHGGHPLQGTFTPSGNSNAALSAIAASLLTDRPVTVSNAPDTLSTNQMLDAARALGSEVTRGGSTLTLHTPMLHTRSLDRDMTEQQVSTVLFLAPLLARRRHARLEITFPINRLHTHLTALRDLGADVRVTGEVIDFQLAHWDQREILLLQTSVTATALVSMLAARMGGDTVIRNAASEPHLQDLLRLLETLGAQIDGAGSNVLHIRGTVAPGSGSVTLAPDHIETASVAALGAITGGTLTIENVNPPDLQLIARVFKRLGVNLFFNGSTLFLPVHQTMSISQAGEDQDVPIETAPWPGFPSDLIAMATVIATQTRGTTLIHEKLFANRLLFVDKLTSMGAQIVLCDPHRALVVGPSRLRGDYMDTPDVRTGLALLGAALCSESSVTIDNAQLIDRTFENVIRKLVNLGAKIEVVQQ